MPLAKINIRMGRSKSEKKELLDIVHLSLVEAFKIPDYDRLQRLYEFNTEEFEIPNDRSDKFTIMEITIFPGRSIEAKKKLYRLIFQKLKKLGYQDNDAIIVLHEPRLENWGLQGGLSGSEIDFGFKLDV